MSVRRIQNSNTKELAVDKRKMDSCDSLLIIPTDVFAVHVITFLTNKDIAIFKRTNKYCYLIVKYHYLDTVHYIAWIDDRAIYHIQRISSTEKQERINNLKNIQSMTYYNDQDKRMEYFLSDETDNCSFDWSLFRRKTHYGIHLKKTKGYWQILGKQHRLVHDLNPIKLMLMHKGIATTVLNENTDADETEFERQITVCIHHDQNEVNKYDVLFWNGASPNQTNAFQVYDHQCDRQRYYMHFKSHIPDIKWKWYVCIICMFVSFLMFV